MSAGQTPRPITTTAPATSTISAPARTTAPTAAPATPANRIPITTPANRSPANANNINQPTQVHPVPSGQPVPTVTPSSARILGENVKELIIITEDAIYDKLLKDVGNKYLLVEFYAPWCGACMLINSKLVELAASYSGKLIIAKVNIDDCEQVAINNNVSMMPSFMLLKDNQVLETFAGSGEEKLMSVIQKHVGEPTNIANGITTTAGQSQQRISPTAQSPQDSALAPT